MYQESLRKTNLINMSTNKSPPVGSRGIQGTENPDIMKDTFCSYRTLVTLQSILQHSLAFGNMKYMSSSR